MQQKKLWIGIAIGVGISIITLGTLFVIFMLLFFFGGPADVCMDIDKYEETVTKYDNMNSALIVFPEELPESARDTDFYFSYQDTWNLPTVEVFLQCTYDEADYQAEIERLENTQKKYVSTVRTLLKDEERYPYPAYIAIDGYWDGYEYALLSGERQITYIYTSGKYSDDLKKVDTKYLPAEYDSRMSQYTGMEGYCIYLKRVDTMNGEAIGWECDYTRDSVVQIQERHYINIDYNLFGVCTNLMEDNTEVIEYCYIWIYEDEMDSITGLPEETQYLELQGYGFESVKLSEDKTKAIVTYYDGEEEKVFEYVISDK